MRDSVSLRKDVRSAREQLSQVFAVCQQPGWDGYDAEPVSKKTYLKADELLNALPKDIPVPSVGVEADGHLTLEWYKSPSSVLSVSVSPEGDLHYAALLGDKSPESGTTSFLGNVP